MISHTKTRPTTTHVILNASVIEALENLEAVGTIVDRDIDGED